MPFTLAHPAAVLPLRRLCPRHLSFPALIVGSLSPDLGYACARFNFDNFSHQPLAGTFGFCLPVGLVLMLGFYLVRLPLVRLLPARQRQALLPLCQQPMDSPFRIAVSIVLGALTHQLLDAATHPQYWLVRYLPVLLQPVPLLGAHHLLWCELLYAACTFFGVAWLALVYLRWWEQNADAALPRAMQWVCALLLASGFLWLALAARSPWRHIRLASIGIYSVLLVIGFLVVTSWRFRPPRSA